MGIFSPAQLAGYLALALGVTAFLQRSDRRLKLFNATQSLAYALHFVLLGNPPAAASAIISSCHGFLAVRYRSLLLAAAIIAVNLAVGAALTSTRAGWLPIAATCIATAAIFTLNGIPLRGALLACTLLWLANNLYSGSIGGTVLELANAVINVTTMIRLARTAPRAIPESPL
jgi:hypothetical protein